MIMSASAKPATDITNQYDASFAFVKVNEAYTWRQIELMRMMLNYFNTIGDIALLSKILESFQ